MAAHPRADVRRATALDIPRMEVLLCAMHAAHPRYSGMAYDRGKTLATVARFLDNPAMVVLVVEDRGVVVGLAVGFAAAQFFGPDFYAGDMALYVATEATGKGLGDALLVALESWAHDRGAGVFSTTMWSLDTVATAPGQHLYERNGYERTGFTMQKRLVPPDTPPSPQ